MAYYKCLFAKTSINPLTSWHFHEIIGKPLITGQKE